MFTQSFFPAEYFAPRYFTGEAGALPGSPTGTAWLSDTLAHGADLFDNALAQVYGSTAAAVAVLQTQARGNGNLSRQLMAVAGAQAAGPWRARAADAAQSETSTRVRLIDGAALAWRTVDAAEAEDAARAAVENRDVVL